jgi:hypothetical protein
VQERLRQLEEQEHVDAALMGPSKAAAAAAAGAAAAVAAVAAPAALTAEEAQVGLSVTKCNTESACFVADTRWIVCCGYNLLFCHWVL